MGDVTPAYALLSVCLLRRFCVAADTRVLYLIRDPACAAVEPCAHDCRAQRAAFDLWRAMRMIRLSRIVAAIFSGEGARDC